MPTTSGMVRTLLERLGLGDDASTAPTGKGFPKPNIMLDGNLGKQTTDIFSFRKRLDHVLSDYRTDTQGHVFLLRLDRVKERMGESWGKSSERLHAGIEAILTRHTSGGDLYIKYDDLSYLLIFLTLNEHEGQLRSIAIADEIARRLTGSESSTEVVRPQGVRLGQDGTVSYVDLPPLHSVVEQTIRALSLKHAAAKPIPEVTPFVPTQPSHLAPSVATIPEHGSTDLSRIKYIYRPLLAVNTSIISTFLCIPSRQDQKGHYLSGYEVLDNPSDPKDIYALDLAILRAGAREVQDLISRGGHSLIALPVHFETLADRHRRIEYIRQIDECLAGHEKSVIFELTESPEGVPQNRLVELVSALKPRSRSIIARFAPDHTNFVAYRVAGLHAVGIDLYNSGKSETDLMRPMENFISEAKKNQLKCYAEGIRTLSLFSIAMTLGFDYLAGYALSAVANSAEEIHKFRLEEPYLAFLNAMRPKTDGPPPEVDHGLQNG